MTEHRKAAEQPPKPERRRGLQPMARLVARVTGPALRRRGLTEARIVTDWRQIVGPMLAEATSPDRLARPRRPEGADGAPPGVLHIRAGGPVATELQHLAPLVIERINAYFGYQAVERLHIIQAPPRVRKKQRAAVAEPSPEAVDAVRAATGAVANDDLRDALNRLGLAVHARRAT